MMSYRLADIDDLAREKILLDVSVNKKICQGLYDAKLMGRFPQTWVFSDDYKCYMTFFPSLARPENMWINLVFFYMGRPYEISITSHFGYDLYLKDRPASEFISDFKLQIEMAFSVFGRDGRGPNDEFGRPSNDLVFTPNFIEMVE